MNNYDFIIFPNYLQTEQLMSAPTTVESEVTPAVGTIRPREEEAQPMSAFPRNSSAYQWKETTMSGYIKTGHMWKKDKRGNIVGYCLHKGCEVHAGASVMPVNCVGNSKYKVEGGVITAESGDGTSVYTRKVADNA